MINYQGETAQEQYKMLNGTTGQIIRQFQKHFLESLWIR